LILVTGNLYYKNKTNTADNHTGKFGYYWQEPVNFVHIIMDKFSGTV